MPRFRPRDNFFSRRQLLANFRSVNAFDDVAIMNSLLSGINSHLFAGNVHDSLEMLTVSGDGIRLTANINCDFYSSFNDAVGGFAENIPQ